MNSIKKARLFIIKKPLDVNSSILARLVLSLESDLPFKLSDMYSLDLDNFDLALDILKEWRLDRYYAGKARLFDVSWQANEMQVSPPSTS